MENSRWWHVAVGTATVLLAVLMTVDTEWDWRFWGAIGCLGLFCIGWILVGRFAYRNAGAALAYTIIVVVASGLGTAFQPSFAFIQFIAYALVWTLAPSVRAAVAWNIAVCVSIVVGYSFSVGTAPAALLQTFTVQLLSLGFSLAFGLWISSIAARSDERQKLLDELHDAQKELAAMNRDAGVTSERERLAREIHDTVAQDLTGLVMLAQRARRETDDLARADQLLMLEENARATLAETRSLVAASAPVEFTHGSLADALNRLGERFSRETGVPVAVTVDGTPALERDTEVVLLRCAQEGLANIRKHAGAHGASISMRVLGATIELEVADDGSGFDQAEPANGFGLAGMRDRLAIVGGSLTVRSSPLGGTTLTATLPVGVRA